jgi:hypothetical protein
MNIQSEAGSMNKHEEILSKYETTLFNKNGQPVKAVTLINAGEALKEYGETLAARTEGDGWNDKVYKIVIGCFEASGAPITLEVNEYLRSKGILKQLK